MPALARQAELQEATQLRAKAMVGGHGLYAGEKFFGILLDGRLFLKTNGHMRPGYEQRGRGPFTYQKARQTLTMRYYEVPPEILENSTEFIEWARLAVQIVSARCRKSLPNARARAEPLYKKNPGAKFRRDE